MSKHHIEVVLVFITNNPKNVKSPILLVTTPIDGKPYLPSVALREQESTIEAAARLLKSLTGVPAKLHGSGWAELVPLPLSDAVSRKIGDDRWIAVPYACREPLTGDIPTPLGYEFCRLATVLEQQDLGMDHNDILAAALQRLI